MAIKKWILLTGLLISLAPFVHAQSGDNPLGQIIRIDTRFTAFVGNPIWTLIIRDIDHNQNIPYLFDIRRGTNHWIALTYGRNYLIHASSLQIEAYQPGCNKYKNFRFSNFCGLESNGRILKGESMHIVIEGVLSPNPSTYSCHVSIFPDYNFYIYKEKQPTP